MTHTLTVEPRVMRQGWIDGTITTVVVRDQSCRDQDTYLEDLYLLKWRCVCFTQVIGSHEDHVQDRSTMSILHLASDEEVYRLKCTRTYMVEYYKSAALLVEHHHTSQTSKNLLPQPHHLAYKLAPPTNPTPQSTTMDTHCSSHQGTSPTHFPALPPS